MKVSVICYSTHQKFLSQHRAIKVYDKAIMLLLLLLLQNYKLHIFYTKKVSIFVNDVKLETLPKRKHFFECNALFFYKNSFYKNYKAQMAKF